MSLALAPLVLGLVASRPPVRRVHDARMGARVDGVLTGEQLPAEVLEALGVQGRRAAVAFYCRDDGFECGKQLRDLEEKAQRFEQEFGCTIVAVRSPGPSVQPDTAGKYPSLSILLDEAETFREAFRMETGGAALRDRHTFVLDAQGRVQGQVNIYSDPFVHAATIVRTLKAMDAGEDAASAEVTEKAAKMKLLYDTEQTERKEREAAFQAKRAAAAASGGVDLRYGSAEEQQSAASAGGGGFLGSWLDQFKKK